MSTVTDLHLLVLTAAFGFNCGFNIPFAKVQLESLNGVRSHESIFPCVLLDTEVNWGPQSD